MSLRNAFFTACKDATPAASWFVSLYVNNPYYGGPEEGGWWGSDTSLVATQEYQGEKTANLAREHVEKLAEQATKDAGRAYGERCLAETEWLDARMLDDDYLPEVDGHADYWVTVEERAGSRESQGCRHYE
jgi:hypothetical protein